MEMQFCSSLYFKWIDHEQHKCVIIQLNHCRIQRFQLYHCHQQISSEQSHTASQSLHQSLSLIPSSLLCLSSLVCLLQRTRWLHRPQESRTRRGLTGECGQPKPSSYWLWTRSHGHLGSGERACHPAHPCHTGNCSVTLCKAWTWIEYQPVLNKVWLEPSCWILIFALCIFHVTLCNHSNWRVCGGQRMEATFSVHTVMEVTVDGWWVEMTWMRRRRRRRNQTFLMVRIKMSTTHFYLLSGVSFSGGRW